MARHVVVMAQARVEMKGDGGRREGRLGLYIALKLHRVWRQGDSRPACSGIVDGEWYVLVMRLVWDICMTCRWVSGLGCDFRT